MMKDGFYWARFTDVGEVPIVVEVRGDYVYPTGDEEGYRCGYFVEIAEFLSKEPLTPPEAP